VVKLECFGLVLFGGTGDFAMPKLILALDQGVIASQIASRSRILAAAASRPSRADHIARSEAPCRKSLADAQFSQTQWRALSRSPDDPWADAAGLAVCAASTLIGRDGYAWRDES
jgi:glucose-6-phosphate 1-dehydrogenase